MAADGGGGAPGSLPGGKVGGITVGVGGGTGGVSVGVGATGMGDGDTTGDIYPFAVDPAGTIFDHMEQCNTALWQEANGWSHGYSGRAGVLTISASPTVTGYFGLTTSRRLRVRRIPAPNFRMFDISITGALKPERR